MQSQHTLEDLREQKRAVLTALGIPGLPADEEAIYRETIASIDAEINALNRSGAAQAARPTRPTPQAPKQGQHAAPSQAFQSRTIIAGGFESTAEPITSKIAQANGSQKHNPTITITWSDGYELTLDETDATNRFRSTLRDAVALQCVQKNRIEKMWRWSTPWRTVGFYQALTSFFGRQPTLQDLGIQRPTEAQKAVFEAIFQKSTETEILSK